MGRQKRSRQIEIEQALKRKTLKERKTEREKERNREEEKERKRKKKRERERRRERQRYKKQGPPNGVQTLAHRVLDTSIPRGQVVARVDGLDATPSFP